MLVLSGVKIFFKLALYVKKCVNKKAVSCYEANIAGLLPAQSKRRYLQEVPVRVFVEDRLDHLVTPQQASS